MDRPDGVGVGIVGLGVYLPNQIRTNDWWPEEWRQEHEARLRTDLTGAVDEAIRKVLAEMDPEIAKHAPQYHADLFRGTRQRRVLAEDMQTTDMEVAACMAALEDAGRSSSDVDCLMGHSTLPDYVGIGNEGLVADKLGLNLRTTAMQVSAGCASLFPQMRLAVRQIQAGDCSTALLYVSSTISRMADYTQPSSVLPGDGAVAAVIGKADSGFGFIDQSCITRGDLHGGMRFVPKSNPTIPWYRTDLYDERLTVQRGDGQATLTMGTRAATLCRQTCDPLFAKTGWSPDDVDFFIVSQSTAWFGAALGEALGIEEEKRIGLAEHFAMYGHLLAGSAPLNLYVARQLGRLRRGDLVLMYSPGIGMTNYATLYRWNLGE